VHAVGEMILTKALSTQISRQVQLLIEEALKQRGVSARRASIDVVGHDGLVRDIRAGRIPSADRLIALFDYLGVDGAKVQGLETLGAVRRRGLAEPSAPPFVVGDHAKNPGPTYGYIRIPFNAAQTQKIGTPPLVFERAWLTGRGLSPVNLSFVCVPSDEMAPSIPKGALAMIEKPVQRPPENAVCAYVDEGKIGLGRISRPAAQTLLIQYEKNNRPVRMIAPHEAGKLHILGRVVWVSHSMETP